MNRDDRDEPECCKVCGNELEWVQCYECCGEGEHDLYDEDPINYAEGEEYETCTLCGGYGGWLECPTTHKTEAK